METSYQPKSIDQLAFEELQRFFRSCPEVANFLTSDQLLVLSWYFDGGKPEPRTRFDEGHGDFTRRMRQDLGVGIRRWPDVFRFAMKKLRARHRALTEELKTAKPSEVKLAFLPWKDMPGSRKW